MNKNLEYKTPTFLIATTNQAKAYEIQRILLGRINTVRPTRQLPVVDENADSLHGNALLKARSAMRETGMSALADDTALEIDALDGRPGLYTARFAHAAGSFSVAAKELLRELEGCDSTKRTARFRTAAVAVMPDGSEVTAWGILEGSIVNHPIGDRGFGFDPIFCPVGARGRTLAELPPDESIAISHRGTAFRSLADTLDNLVYRPSKLLDPRLADFPIEVDTESCHISLL
jgi:XTP/dITP diphosphohydrolase